eukprot:Clim_evm15s29 gene=Clim_evmTU15s29
MSVTTERKLQIPPIRSPNRSAGGPVAVSTAPGLDAGHGSKLCAHRNRVAFVCGSNSCRSQMAEVLCRKLRPEIDCVSGGLQTKPGKVINPFAIRVLEEIGLGVDELCIKDLGSIKPYAYDLIVVLCECDSHMNVPSHVQGKVVLRSIDAPSNIVKAMGTEVPDEEKIAVYRRVRDQISELIRTLKVAEDVKD